MSLRWKDEQRALDLSVQDLLAAEQSHLERQSALSTRARLEAGVEAHRRMQAEAEALSEGYAAEVAIRHRLEVRGWTVTLHGRMDGLLTEEGAGGLRTVVEEIKSSLLSGPDLELAELPSSWTRQLHLYLWMLIEARRPDPVGRLRVVSLLDGAIRQEAVAPDPGIEKEVLEILDERILQRERRNAWLAERRRHPLPFAFPEPRPGQEEATRAAAAAVAQGKVLLLEAPTGMGKTAAALHGALREARARDLQILWVTARTTQRRLVTDTLRAVERARLPGGPGVRAVTLMAKGEFCLQPVIDCRPDSCRFACYYQLKRRATDAIERVPALPTTEELRALGHDTELCPHALAVDRSALVDVIVGDYNHALDGEARVRDLDPARCVLIVDEAHQLPERAMEAASPALSRGMVMAVVARYTQPEARVFREIATQILEEIEDAPLLHLDAPPQPDGQGGEEVQVELNPRRWRRLCDRIDEVGLEHLRLAPTLSASPGSPLFDEEEDPWVVLARAVQRFARCLEESGEETVALAGGVPAAAGGERWLRLWCRDPAPILGPLFEQFAAAICMSATLSPLPFFRDRCGLPPDRVDTLSLSGVFPAANRLVVAVPGVSTTWARRNEELPKIVEIVQRCVLAAPGNVALYAASFQQLRDIYAQLDLPGHVILQQTPAMDEAARRRMVEAVMEPGPPRLLMAVMGGIFAEGVDMPGRLSAVLIVSPSLPVPGLGRALQQQWYEGRYGDGFFHTFIHPGMTRVVQAAGRVIRGPEERGAVILICRRFLQAEYRKMLPPSWELIKHRRPWEPLQRFFPAPALPEQT